jgi:hypothetical protein
MTSLQSEQWIKPTNKRGRPSQDGSFKDSKLAKPSDHWFNPTPISNRFTTLQQDEDLNNHPPPGKEASLKHPPIYITSVTNIPPLLQLLDQIVPQFYEVKALAQNQLKVQPKTPDSYRLITKALLDRQT